MEILVGTKTGLVVLDEKDRRRRFEGDEVDAIADGWLSLGRRVVSAESSAERPVDGLRAWCLAASVDTLYVGTSEAHVYAGSIDGDELRPVASFDAIPSRTEWYTPWGGLPDVRSIAMAGDGALLVNVHVGGVWRSPDTAHWDEVIAVDDDTHQVVVDDRSGVVAAAAAVGVGTSLDGGRSWSWSTAGLHGSYCRAAAVAGSTLLVSASTGPGSREGAVYRRPLEALDTPFVRGGDGLPPAFPFNVNTFQLAADGDRVVLGTEDGSLFESPDAGASWRLVADDLGAIRCVALGGAP